MALLEVHLLGPVEVRFSGTPVALDRLLERALVARLALARGTPVPDARLVRDLWGDMDLARPRERLRVLVSRLRASLGPAATALSRTAAGYALDAVPVDLVAAEEGREVVWRGDALADLREIPFAAMEGARLDALLLDLKVAKRPSRGELTRLVAEHPLHERLSCLLAVALYRDGQQAEALAVLARLRAALAEELGVDPAPETVRTELRLLRHSLPPAPRLPEPGTTFLGRDAERAALVGLLRGVALVTLTGPAGCGKTRLALETARVTERPVVWLDLTPSREDIVPALLAALGTDSLRDAAERLEGALLLVDNAEHLVPQVAELVRELRRSTEGLAVLVTSQRPLLISGEQVRPVAPLDPEAAASLFRDRSGAAPGPAVTTICAAVDHLPLGVELAAGLTRALTVDQLAERLDDRLTLLVGGSRDQGARHTSLRDALDWSHDLLDPVGRAVLRRLSVFAGGCTLEAAEQVVPGEGVERADVAPALVDLKDRSLVAGGPRFRLLETVRHHAFDRLRSVGEEERLLRRHLDWCRQHVSSFEEWPNLLGALDLAAGTSRAADGLRLALLLDDTWQVRGLFGQAARIYAALVDAPGVTDAERARALSNYGFACTQLGRSGLAAELLDRAAGLAQGDELTRVRYHRGIAEIERGRLDLALESLRQGDGQAFLSALGVAHMYAGHLDEALAAHAEANRLDRERGDEHGLVRGLVNEAQVFLAMGRTADALARAGEAEELARRLGDAVGLTHVGIVRGRAANSVELLRTALEHAEPGNDADLIRIDLAQALLESGRHDEARTLLDEVNRAERDLVWLVALPTEAALACAAGDADLAAKIRNEARTEYATRSFGWPLALERLG